MRLFSKQQDTVCTSLFFFYFLQNGVLAVFWGLYLQALNYSYVAIGSVIAIISLSKCISPLLLGTCSYFQKNSLVRLIQWVYGITFLGMFWMSKSTDYPELLASSAFFGFFWTSLVGLFDAIALQKLKISYVRARLWGTVGFLGVLVIGWFVSDAYIHKMPIILLVLVGVGFFFSLFLTNESKPNALPLKNNASGCLKTQQYNSFDRFKMIVIFMILQGAHGGYYGFFSIDLSNHNYTNLWITWFWSVSLLAEILFFVYVPYYLHKLKLNQWLYLACFISVFRWFVTPFVIHSAWMLTVLQTTHAVTFGLSHVLAVFWYQHYFSGNYQKSMSVYSATAFGFGNLVGVYAGGWLWTVNSTAAYWMASLAAVLAIFLLLGLSKHSIEIQ